MAEGPVADFSVKPTLIGELITLRPFRSEDLAALRDILADPEVGRLTGSAHDDATSAFGPDRQERLASWYGGRNDQTDRLDLAIVDRMTGRCVGEAVLNGWDAGNRSCSFRVLIGPAGQTRGLGTEAVRMTTGYGFERLGPHRVSLEVYAFNPRARRAYEKARFVAEGVPRQALRYNDEWIDCVVMSILAPQWARHRGHPGDPDAAREGPAAATP